MPDGLRPAAAERPSAEPVPVRLRSIALPVEHGGWGLLGEPIVVGLVLAPSWAGLGVALLALFAFLARHPLRLAAADWRQGRRTERSRVAERVALAYAAAALAALALASRGPSGWWWPLAAAAPLALLQLALDSRNRGRRLLPEMAGAVALGSVAAAELIAGGATPLVAIVVWTLLAAKAVAAILYVRARLRCDRNVAFDWKLPVLAHLGLVALTVALAARGHAPWLVTAAAAVLLVRAVAGLSPHHRRVRPQVVGFAELGYGITFAAVLAIGYAAGW